MNEESVFVLDGEVAPDAITASLHALLPSRRQPIPRRRFTVLDTFDGRIRRSGARLSLSISGGVHDLTWISPGRGEMTVRVPAPACFSAELPDGPFRRTLTPITGVRRLFAQAEAEEYGSALDVLDEAGKTVARVRVRSGRVRLPQERAAWSPLPTIVTVAGLRGYEGARDRVLPVIESRPGIRRSGETAEALLFRHAGAAEPFCVSPRVELFPAIPACEGARRIQQALLRMLVANEPGVRARLDTEFLHDYRVAVRRIRSLLRQIKGAFPEAAVQTFSAEFAWLGRLTGPPRDIDVLVQALGKRTSELSDDADALLPFLEARQKDEHRALVQTLDGTRYRELISTWQAFLDQPVWSQSEPGPDAATLAEVVGWRAWRLSRRIARRAESVDSRTPVAHLHDIRIDAKKLRYLVDVTAGFYNAADLDRILAALKKLQRALGDFNDAQVQHARLLEIAGALSTEPESAAAARAARHLATVCRERGQSLRPLVAARLAAFCEKKTRAACRRAFKHAPVLEATR